MSGRSRLSALREDRVLLAVLAILVVGLAARLAFLGARIAHQDEARVGYWTMRYLASGRWEYRPIVHGPYIPILNRHVFALVGASDFSSRLVVAVTGAAMPGAALLFRRRLRDAETVALALVLAFNPVLLYYSRFMRQDVPLATFALLTAGLAVRAIDADSPDRRRTAILGATLAFALATTTKENVLLYPVCWLGALALLVDHRLFRAGPRGTDARTLVADRLAGLRRSPARARASVRRWGRRWLPVAVGAVGLYLVVVVFFYAPRGGGYPDPAGDATVGLHAAVGSLDPGAVAAVVEEATLGSWREFYGQWVAGESQDHAYLPYLRDFLETMRAGALVVSTFAVLGFVLDRYAPDGPRDLVAFAGYWGAASVAGYPLATDIQAPWATVHAVVPLAIPAAVGLAAVYRRGRGALADDDRPSVAAAVLVVLLVVGQVGVAATDLVYARPQAEDNDLVQYAQSSSTDLRPVLRDVERLARTNDGVDVVYYGTDLRSPNESDHDQPPAGAGWFDRLPIAWYTETFHQDFGDDADLRVTSTLSAREVADTGAPVVVALRSTEANTVSFDADGVAPSLEGYGRWEGQRYLYASAIAVFVDRDRLSDPAGTYGPTGGPGERAGTGPTTAPTGNRTAER